MVMKRVFLFILVVLLINPFIYANVTPYGFGGGTGDLEVSRPDDKEPAQTVFFRFGNQPYIKNRGPVTTLNYPTDGKVVSGNLVEFSWTYFDAEGDEQVNYNLELDDDPGFYSPLSYFGLSETKRKIYIVEGDKPYYWRAKSKDVFGWGEFSQAEEFFIDLTKKECEDGTPYFQCSISDFKYCDGGELVEDCSLCGCPLNSECTLSGKCTERTCFDGTKYGTCGNKKPEFCQNGNLKEVCSLCGCLEGKECNVDGTCSKTVIKEEVITVKSEKKGFFEFLRFLFGFK